MNSEAKIKARIKSYHFFICFMFFYFCHFWLWGYFSGCDEFGFTIHIPTKLGKLKPSKFKRPGQNSGKYIIFREGEGEGRLGGGWGGGVDGGPLSLQIMYSAAILTRSFKFTRF